MRIAIAEAEAPEPSITILATIPCEVDEGRRIVGLVIDQLCSVATTLGASGRGCVITWEVVPMRQASAVDRL